MVNAARLTFVDDSSHHCSSSARKPYAFATPTDLALYVKLNGPLLPAKEIMVNYKQFGFIGSAFSGYKNDTSDVSSPERGKRVMVAAMQTEDVGVAKRLHSEQKSDSLRLELVFYFTQPEDPHFAFIAGTLLMAVDCFTEPSHRAFFWGRDGFRVLSFCERSRVETICKSCSRCWDGR